MQIISFKNLRVLVLISLFAIIANYVKDQKLVTQGWYKTLEVVIYPVNPANSRMVERYIATLTNDHFSEIENFITRESQNYDIVSSKPVQIRVGKALHITPPQPPDPGNNPVKAIFWSLKLRWWIWQHAPEENNPKYLVRMFVLYHEPSLTGRLKHSVGLQKGLVGLVNAYGVQSQTRQNNIIIAHELLHTVGASDKYDALGQPALPDGLANPEQDPIYPQKKAEIMAGRRALSASRAEMPGSFKNIVIGKKTAEEIGWSSAL